MGLERLLQHPGRGGCGVGAIVDLHGRASHALIEDALAALGGQARAALRDVFHVLVGEGMVPEEDFPLTFWRVKAELEHRVRELYVASFSPKTMVYKALATGEQLRAFYSDLADPSFATDAVLFHRRFSTNTFSNWYLAQVFRALGHNGEINTIK